MSHIQVGDHAKERISEDSQKAEIAAERATPVLSEPSWLDGLTHKDWLFDGSEIKSRVMIERFKRLDWSNAWVDLGPSLAGNLGPYWHVPLMETVIDGEIYDCGDTVHRLYPKLLQSKWLLVVRQACKEVKERTEKNSVRESSNREVSPSAVLSEQESKL